jgi:hypothetical protein
MKIASDKTYQEFDKLIDQLTAHKKKSPIDQSQSYKKPVNGRFRWVMPLFLMIGGGWLAYRNIPAVQ